MEVSSGIFNLCPTKRKAEFDPEEDGEEEEIDGEIEERGDWKTKIDNSEADKEMLKVHGWDVDSFDGLEYFPVQTRTFPLMRSLIPTCKSLQNTIASINARSLRARDFTWIQS